MLALVLRDGGSLTAAMGILGAIAGYPFIVMLVITGMFIGVGLSTDNSPNSQSKLQPSAGAIIDLWVAMDTEKHRGNPHGR
jgi:hypothetical protein